jgi:hypothetical protein
MHIGGLLQPLNRLGITNVSVDRGEGGGRKPFRVCFQGANQGERFVFAPHILEGSVAREGNHVKVTARLGKSSDGSQVWSHVYERQTSDLLSLLFESA